MRSIPVELLYGLAIAAFFLLRYLLNRLGQRLQQSAAQPEQLQQVSEEENETTTAYALPVAGVGQTESPTASALLPTRRFSRRSLMGTRRDVQNAVVIATVLGSCRAFEPHEVR